MALLLVSSVVTNVVFLYSQSSHGTRLRENVFVEFHDSFIDSLNTRFGFNDPDQVLELLLSRMKSQVIVYPTENYYYFKLYAGGRSISGNLQLDATDRDAGIIHLTYFPTVGHDMPAAGAISVSYSSEKGVRVQKVEEFIYSVEFKGIRVIFRLNDLSIHQPKSLSLASDEIFIGPVFDESGIIFALVFNSTENHFMYLLNEDGYVPESFGYYSADIEIGERTGFAFYIDKTYRRRILVGVNYINEWLNNYYDGPFDQLPDNYANQTNIKKYIERAYPDLIGLIDVYGNYKEDDQGRVVISPYITYAERKELDFIRSCKDGNQSEAQFYTCITPDRQERRIQSERRP